ncbi:D-alanyl-D-alanine carboxypeptidase [Lactobacillus sp. S2-2]|uniref:D-alanyl-D-alanine carboxypeptidase family protein n=1 Tax=Lactobacillus sp. S2-2 TaxID=2692917 RepID=UPI001F2FFD72|nr:D-alanyl-D-alanine carboxypeptidase family protein [Lactobacillus sp. S2-2]MCF6515203.1 D-alanyl-D-alanine carboxypeptidase [Lactobacillus sp. S2-2]
MKVKFLIINIITIFAGFILFNLQVSASEKPNLDIKAGISVDAKSGQILYSKNENKKVSVASMSKLLSIYILLDQIHSNKLKWNDKVSINQDIENICTNYDSVNLNLKSGEKYTVKQLYEAALINSSNSAILALGNKIAGSNANFVNLMKKKSEQLKIKNAELYNSCGLSNDLLGSMKLKNVSGNATNKLSAIDMVNLTQKLVSQYPEIIKTSKKYHYTFKHKGMMIQTTNSNQLLKGGVNYDPALHVDGLKTGTSDNEEDFTGTGTFKHRRIITVIIGAKTDQRYIQTKKLMKWVDHNYQIIKLNNQNIKNQTVKVNNGKKQDLKVSLNQNYEYWQLKSEKLNNAFHNKLMFNNNLEAPIKKDQKVGQLNVNLTSNNLKFVPGYNNKLNLYATESVEKANFLVRCWRSVASIF